MFCSRTEVQFTIRCLNALNACTLHNEFCHDFLFHQYSTFYQSICKIFPTFFPGFNSCVRILDNIFNCLAKVQYKLERQFYIINETNAALPSTSRSNSDVQSCNGDFSEHTNRIRGPWEKKRPMLLHDWIVTIKLSICAIQEGKYTKQLTKVVGCRMREVIYRKRKKDKSEDWRSIIFGALF